MKHKKYLERREREVAVFPAEPSERLPPSFPSPFPSSFYFPDASRNAGDFVGTARAAAWFPDERCSGPTAKGPEVADCFSDASSVSGTSG